MNVLEEIISIKCKKCGVNNTLTTEYEKPIPSFFQRFADYIYYYFQCWYCKLTQVGIVK
jgi:hypothetical protein